MIGPELPVGPVGPMFLEAFDMKVVGIGRRLPSKKKQQIESDLRSKEAIYPRCKIRHVRFQKHLEE